MPAHQPTFRCWNAQRVTEFEIEAGPLGQYLMTLTAVDSSLSYSIVVTQIRYPRESPRVLIAPWVHDIPAWALDAIDAALAYEDLTEHEAQSLRRAREIAASSSEVNGPRP